MCGLGDSARPPHVSTSASAARGSWRSSEATSPLSRSSEPAASGPRPRLMIEDHLMTPLVSQIASGAPDPIKLGARKMGGNLGASALARPRTMRYRTARVCDSERTVRFRRDSRPTFAITFRRAPLESRSGSRLGCRGMPLAGRRQLGCPAADSRRVWVLAWLHVYWCSRDVVPLSTFVSVVARVRRAATLRGVGTTAFPRGDDSLVEALSRSIRCGHGRPRAPSGIYRYP